MSGIRLPDGVQFRNDDILRDLSRSPHYIGTDLNIHLSDDALDGYVLWTLHELQEVDVEIHLLICPGGRERLSKCDRFISAAGAVLLNK